MKKLVVIAMLMVAGSTPAQTVRIIASHFGGPMPVTGSIVWQPVLADGTKVSAQQGGGGQATMRPFAAQVTNGAFNLPGPLDTNLSQPQICYRVTATANGVSLLGPGYTCVAPAANNYWCANGVCDFDKYIPNVPATQQNQVVPPQLAIGTVERGDGAAASFSGSAPNWLLNLTLPKGNTGDTGAPGPNTVTNATATPISGVLSGNAISVQAATSAQMQAAIGAGVYDAFGAAAAAIADSDPLGSAASVQSASLQKSANLSDLQSVSTARTNLGLGTAATHAVTEFDASGAGAAAQAASDLAGAAAAAQSASLQKSSNLSDLQSASTARTNLGLGTAATHAVTEFDASGAGAAAQAASDPAGAAAAAQSASLQKSSNLSDLQSASTARTNLGLGTAAMHAAGDFDTSGAAAAAIATIRSGGNTFATANTVTGWPAGCVQWPCVVAWVDQTGLSANVSTTGIYSVPAAGGGTYQVACFVVIIQPATSSGTLPSCGVTAYDLDYIGTARGIKAAGGFASIGLTQTSTANGSEATGLPAISAAGLQGVTTIHVAPSTTISYLTSGYVSSGATPLLYAVHVVVVYLHP